MSKGKNNDFERVEGGEIIRVRNRYQAKQMDIIKFEMKIRKGNRNRKWSMTGQE